MINLDPKQVYIRSWVTASVPMSELFDLKVNLSSRARYSLDQSPYDTEARIARVDQFPCISKSLLKDNALIKRKAIFNPRNLHAI